jgi:hypothetical protein
LPRGELVCTTPSSEGCAVAAHRFNRVVVRRSRRKVSHRHAVDHVRETLIPPVDRFCLATEVFGIRAIVHHRVLDQAAASIGRPSDDGGFVGRRFQCRSLIAWALRQFVRRVLAARAGPFRRFLLRHLFRRGGCSLGLSRPLPLFLCHQRVVKLLIALFTPSSAPSPPIESTV